MRSSLALALAASHAIGGAACTAPPIDEPLADLTLKVATYNVRHDVDEWERRMPIIADEIVRLQPDLVGLQEVEFFVEQAEVLAALVKERDASLDYAVHWQPKPYPAGDLTGEAVGALSRVPYELSAHLDMSEGRVSVRERVTIEGHVIDLYNTHLHADGPDDDVRLEQVQALTAWIEENDEGHPTFLTGDMNDTTDESPALAHLAAQGFVDTYVAVHGAEVTAAQGNTSPIVLADGTTEQNPTRRIDFVFAKEHARVSATDSVVCFDVHDDAGLWASDHLGVMTTFTIAGD